MFNLLLRAMLNVNAREGKLCLIGVTSIQKKSNSIGLVIPLYAGTTIFSPSYYLFRTRTHLRLTGLINEVEEAVRMLRPWGLSAGNRRHYGIGISAFTGG